MNHLSTNWSNTIPRDLLLMIFKHHSHVYATLVRIDLVCKKWHQVVAELVEWHKHHESCLRQNIKEKSWSKKIINIVEHGQTKIRELIIDKSKSIYVLFDGEKSCIYRLSRKGDLTLHHQFNQFVTSVEAISFLGGKFDDSTSQLFGLEKYKKGGEWQTIGNYREQVIFAHHLKILDGTKEVIQDLPMFYNSRCQIEAIARIEQYGKYFLSCQIKGINVGNSWSDEITRHVVWKKSKKQQHGLKPVLQLSLSDRAVLIDGLYIDIIDGKKIILENLSEKSIDPENTCSMM